MRFRQAFNETVQVSPEEMTVILHMIDEEVVALNKAIQNGGKPSDTYKQFGTERELTFNIVTKGRYLNLAATNFDHFGDGALAVYKAGHAVALKIAERAAKGELSQPGVPLTRGSDHRT